MKKRRIQYYTYSPENMNFREIRWYRLKIFSTIFGLASLFLIALLIVNHFYFHILELGNEHVIKLERENSILRNQLTHLNIRAKDLHSMLDNLHQQGNRLRLLVDLPVIDEQTRQGGIGGAVSEPVFQFEQTTVGDFLLSSITLLDRLSGEVKLQSQSYEEITKKYDLDKDFFASIPALKPTEGFYTTKGFGMRMHPVLGIFKQHNGLDIVNDVGAPIYASGNGVVEFAGQSGGGYGHLIIINHGYDYQTLYAHLSKIVVKEGERVKRGDLIAESGKTGLVTGPHLHYEVVYKGVRQNPMDYFLDDVTPTEYLKGFASQP